MSPVYKIGDSKVVESRESNDGMMIRRRRETLDGKFRFTTYERIERPAIIVLKQSGQKELFDRGKLLNAIRKSVGKFFESELEVEDVVSKVEDAVYMLGEEEIKSKIIGEKVLEVLADANEVAYVRFASVFREFKSLGEFERILTEVQRKKGKDKDKDKDKEPSPMSYNESGEGGV